MLIVVIDHGEKLYPKDFLIYDKVVVDESYEGEHPKIEKISFASFFMKSHSTARKLNRKLFSDIGLLQKPQLVSLLKMTDKWIYKSCRLIHIANLLHEKYSGEITFRTRLNHDLFLFVKKKLDYGDIGKIESNSANSVHIFRIMVSIIQNIFLAISLVLKSKLIKLPSFFGSKLLVTYDNPMSYGYLKYFDQNSLTFPYFSIHTNKRSFIIKPKTLLPIKIMTFECFIGFLSELRKIFFELINAKSIPKPLQKIFLLELPKLILTVNIFRSVIISYPNIREVFGLFDTFNEIDYIRENLNNLGIRITTVPHGINYKYKVNYISAGSNQYLFWSQKHSEAFLDNKLIEDSCSFIVVGNPQFKDLRDKYILQRSKNKPSLGILVIGEYFSHDSYYTSPFNRTAATKFFQTLAEFHQHNQHIKLTVRTRLHDTYYDCAMKTCTEQTIFSDPNRSIFEEIMEHDLVITVFSNALHEALLLERNVIQVNFLEIENYRTLAENGFVHYATNQEELLELLRQYVNGGLKRLKLGHHRLSYCNDAKYSPQIIEHST